MRRVVVALAATATCIAGVIGVKAQSAGTPRSALGAAATGGARPGGAPASTAPRATAGPTGKAARPSAGASTSAGRSGAFTGKAVDTRYGTVQVRAVLSGGRLTDVVVLQQTQGGRSSSIDAYALPVLKSEALKKQSAAIDVVSGATYTSGGYAQSLQAALDAAGK